MCRFIQKVLSCGPLIQKLSSNVQFHTNRSGVDTWPRPRWKMAWPSSCQFYEKPLVCLCFSLQSFERTNDVKLQKGTRFLSFSLFSTQYARIHARSQAVAFFVTEDGGEEDGVEFGSGASPRRQWSVIHTAETGTTTLRTVVSSFSPPTDIVFLLCAPLMASAREGF